MQNKYVFKYKNGDYIKDIKRIESQNFEGNKLIIQYMISFTEDPNEAFSLSTKDFKIKKIKENKDAKN